MYKALWESACFSQQMFAHMVASSCWRRHVQRHAPRCTGNMFFVWDPRVSECRLFNACAGCALAIQPEEISEGKKLQESRDSERSRKLIHFPTKGFLMIYHGLTL